VGRGIGERAAMGADAGAEASLSTQANPRAGLLNYGRQFSRGQQSHQERSASVSNGRARGLAAVSETAREFFLVGGRHRDPPNDPLYHSVVRSRSAFLCGGPAVGVPPMTAGVVINKNVA